MDNITFVEHISDKFNNITKKPEKFLSAPEKIIDNIKECLKETYDFIKKGETTKTSNTLTNLIVENFDVEQIWQQIELQNNDILSKHLRSVGRLVAQKENLWLLNDDSNEHISDGENISNGENRSDGEKINDDGKTDDKNNESFDDDDDEGEEDATNTIKSQGKNINNKKTKHLKKSSVDDDFFKLDEMEKFLNQEEQATKSKSHENSDDDDDDDDEESVDLFDMKSGDEFEEDKEEISDVENNPKYDEFFAETNETENNKRKRRTEGSSDDDDDDELEKEDIKIKSSLELKNERLHRRIENIEEQALQDKSWQYKGEVTADKRPQNSLLEEIVDFDMTVRPAPVITEETTYKLEDVIKKRIKDKVWDDVERKTKLVDSFIEFKKKLVLDQEKSKQSLAQIYENDFLKQKEASNPDDSDKPEEEPKEHTEIKSLMRNLFAKLDALSNFHFTPKSVAPELRIVNNLPAINMEEVMPVASSDAASLAPEEIKKKTKGLQIGKAERTKTDKNRERRQKKTKQREHAKEIKNKEKTTQKKGKKYDKQKAGHLLEKITKDSNVNKMKESEIGAKSSTAFFTQLQDEVRGHIKKKTAQMKKNNKPTHIAKKIKIIIFNCSYLYKSINIV